MWRVAASPVLQTFFLAPDKLGNNELQYNTQHAADNIVKF